MDVSGNRRGANRPEALLGSRCGACGTTAYPASAACVFCGAAKPQAVELADWGFIESCSRIGPRWLCEIRLADGPLILGWLNGQAPGAVAVGKVARRVRSSGGDGSGEGGVDDSLRFATDA